MKKRVSILLTRSSHTGENLVYLVRNKLNHKWTLIHGKVKKNELVEGAAKREAEEESGYLLPELENTQTIYTYVGTDEKNREFFLFTGRVQHITQRSLVDDTGRWFSKKEAVSVINKKEKEFIDNYVLN